MPKVTQLYYHQVYLAEELASELSSLPSPVLEKVQLWTDIVENMGLKKARRIKEFHDRSLGKHRSGYRTIELGQGYQALYSDMHTARLELSEVYKLEGDDEYECE